MTMNEKTILKPSIAARQGFLQIHPEDNVLVALHDLPRGTVIDFNGRSFPLPQDIPAKHKFLTRPVPAGKGVYMYGVLVGLLNSDLPEGGRITRENTIHSTEKAVIRDRRYIWTPPDTLHFANRQFMGYHRANGKIGTANHWIIVPLVFCENRNVDMLRQAFTDKLGYGKTSPYQAKTERLIDLYKKGATADEISQATFATQQQAGQDHRLFKNIDGVKFLTHHMGCCSPRTDAASLCGLIAGYITHPNVGGATILSLGCQNAQLDMLEAEIKRRDPNFNKPLVLLEQQRVGTETHFMDEALRQTFVGLIRANEAIRQPASISQLCMGLECGGSDGFSGISANPALGHASDLLVACGGSSILSEFPELCGAEQELVDRCVSNASAEKFLHLMEVYHARAEKDGSGFYANPTEGNIRDGLITDAIKSLGAARKGGSAPVADVLDYPEPCTKSGLNLLCTPGSDIESVTALVGAGANIVLFTTGMGTPTGNPIAPTIKLSSNTQLYKKMSDIIDIDCGSIIEGASTIEELGQEILDYVIRAASGQTTPRAVQLGQDDFMPWKRGISL
jgi:altronate hydrolase